VSSRAKRATMTDTQSSSLATYSYEQASALMRAASDAHWLQQHGQAVVLYERALQIAEALDWTDAIIYCRAWCANALQYQDLVRQAMAMLAPLLQIGPPSSRHEDYYEALLTYARIGKTILASLPIIEAAYTRAEQFLHDSGRLAWRHKLLLSRSNLCDMRGLEAEALQLAQEAWACWQEDSTEEIADNYLSALVDLSRQLDNLEQARRYLEEWERQPDIRPNYRQRLISIDRSLLARQAGDFHEALEWARRAMTLAEQADRPSLSASGALIRAYLCLGEAERARPLLACVLPLRHSQSIFTRYSVQRLRGDFHLAYAREAAGMPPIYSLTQDPFPIPSRIVRTVQVRAALGRAAQAYTIAIREGRIIDEKLECSWRLKSATKRLARVAEIAQHLDG
jgi:tetratricopeptide (TPR) repeat protein